VDNEIRPHATLLVEGAGIEDLLRLEGLLVLWSSRMSVTQAQRAGVWMLQNGILEPVA
jgi:hypothetical protein